MQYILFAQIILLPLIFFKYNVLSGRRRSGPSIDSFYLSVNYYELSRRINSGRIVGPAQMLDLFNLQSMVTRIYGI